MVTSVHGICHIDSQDLAGKSCHPPIATASVFRHNQCCHEVVVKLILRLEPLHVLIVHVIVL
jgi:hypothetical protein